MKKDLAYYMNLSYPVVITEIDDEEGGGYSVSIPMLGEYAYVGDGETIEEALTNLEDVKRYLFQRALNKNVAIPEPEGANEAVRACSGRFVVRVSRELHYKLKIQAEVQGVSLNRWVEYLLASSEAAHDIVDDLKRDVMRHMRRVSRDVGMISYHLTDQIYDLRFRTASRDDEPEEDDSSSPSVAAHSVHRQMAAA